MTKTSRAILELRVRFTQSRADAIGDKANSVCRRLLKLQKQLNELNLRQHDLSEKAAGLRGLLSIMDERGCDTMRVVNGYCEFSKEGVIKRIHVSKGAK